MSTTPSGSSNTETAPVLCANKCGFYGNPQTENMCSKCYRDSAKTRQPASSPSFTPSKKEELAIDPKSTPQTTAATSESVIASASEGAKTASVSSANSTPSKAPAPNRCFSCKRKVGMLGFKCRCEHTFCGEHRHADKHECPFDYKAHDRARLEQANPVVAGSKIQKI